MQQVVKQALVRGGFTVRFKNHKLSLILSSTPALKDAAALCSPPKYRGSSDFGEMNSDNVAVNFVFQCVVAVPQRC